MSSFKSTFQMLKEPDVNFFKSLEDRNREGQSDSGFGGGDSHDKKHHNLTFGFAGILTEGYEGQINRIQH